MLCPYVSEDSSLLITATVLFSASCSLFRTTRRFFSGVSAFVSLLRSLLAFSNMAFHSELLEPQEILPKKYVAPLLITTAQRENFFSEILEVCLVSSYIIICNHPQRCIQNAINYLRWNFYQK